MFNNVKDFGALGDGVADDRAAIQTAIDNASASGIAGILFPAGTYRVSRVTSPGGRWSLDLRRLGAEVVDLAEIREVAAAPG